MARKAKRIYVPLDASFFDDDKVIEAGEAAAVLYLAMLCRIKTLDTDGSLSKAQMQRIGVQGAARRLARLVAVGLVEQHGDQLHVPAWAKWNETRSERGERLEAERKRKADAAAARRGEHLQVVDGGRQ